MGKMRDRVRSMLHWPHRTHDRTASDHKQEGRWEGEGGALHPAEERDPPSQEPR